MKTTGRTIHHRAKALRQVRWSLPDSLTKTVSSTIVSRLDYCNSLLVGTTKANLKRLQVARNTIARVSETKRYEHIRLVLSSLHWLPVEQIIKFYVVMMTRESVNPTSSRTSHLSSTTKSRQDHSERQGNDSSRFEDEAQRQESGSFILERSSRHYSPARSHYC